MNPFTPPAAPLDASVATQLGSAQRVEIRNSVLDQLLLQVYMQSRLPLIWLIYVGGPLFMAYKIAETQGTGYFMFVAVVMLCVSAFLLTLVNLAIVVIHKDRNFRRPRVIEISAQAVTDTTELTSFVVRWPAVEGVVRTPWSLYIRLSPSLAHCIPPRAFADGDAYARFANAAVTYYEHAHRKGAG